MDVQVLIVGAGPVGLTMANELTRYGIGVRIVDKAAARTDKSKALVVWSRTLELLDRGGDADMFVAAGRKMRGANMIAAGGKPIGRVEIEGVDSPFSFALMLPQSETERLLEERLAARGVRVERAVEATDFTEDGHGIVARLRHPDLTEETVAAAWLIGCDGAHSMVRHKLALPFTGDTLDSDWVLADVHLRGVPFPDDEIGGYLHEDGILILFPITPGRYRVIVALGPSKGAQPADPTLEDVQALIDARGPGSIVASDPVWLSAFRINERMVDDYRHGRAFLVGDAAHVHSPAGGQGMNTGMQDAINLAWKLALVCSGDAAEGLLDSYSVERHPIGRQVMTAAGRMTTLVLLRNPIAQGARNLFARIALGLGPVRRKMVEAITEVSIGYAESPLNGPAAHALDGPEPGERMPPREGDVPPGSGEAPRFALYAEADAAIAALQARYPKLIDAVVRRPIAPGGIWLVRPDGYVACTARDTGTIADYLNAAVVAGA